MSINTPSSASTVADDNADCNFKGNAANSAAVGYPLKVTHVVRQYLPSIGGMEEVVRNIALQQKRNSAQQVRIITLNRLFRNSTEVLPAHELLDGVEVIRLPYFGSSRYPVCLGILRELKGADIVHVHGVDFFYDFLALTKFWHKRPLILSTHGGFFHTGFASRLKTIYFNTVTRLAGTAYDRVVATSANDGNLFKKILSTRKLQIIENGVDIEKFSDQASPTLKPNLIYFGRWSANKGLLEALQFLLQLRAKSAEWTLTITGREYDHSQAELLNTIASMGLSDAVTLVANPSDAQIKQLIHNASYFICLSHHEGFGIAPIEGMSAGLLPVLSDIPPFKQLVEQSRQGIIVNHNASVDSAIQQLLNTHQQGEPAYQVRRTAAMEAAQTYAWQKVAAHYLRLYQQLGTKA